MKTIVDNGRVITRREMQQDGGVVLIDGKIAEVFRTKPRDNGCDERIDVGGLFISPGFVDAHIHGGGGADVMDGSAEAVLQIAKVHERHGLTAFLPTTVTVCRDRIRTACDAVRAAQKDQTEGAAILGIHVEGPFISRRYKGAQNADYLLEPSVERFLDITGGGEGVLRVSMAPELPGAFALSRYLAARGILVSVAHSDADYGCMRQAVQNGFRHITHFFNGMSGMRSPDFYCRSGVIESGLELDGYRAEVICDGRHVPPELIRLLVQCKGVQNVMLTSDATSAADMPPGRYALGGLPVIVEDGVSMLADRSSFAGSVATADRLVRTAVRDVGLDLVSAVNMLSHNVAASIGVADRIGSLEAGKNADLVVFDENIAVHLVMRSGRVTVHADGRVKRG